MNDIARQVYVISDLHLGGEKGFQLCTHTKELESFIKELVDKPKPPNGPKIELVINGDFVDFLAEKDESGEWEAFTENPDEAVKKLQKIAGKDQEEHVFAALGNFLKKGHRLTILLGNHDIELSFPKCRQKLEELLGVESEHKYRFIYDGEAYVVGKERKALIEHGNRYDNFNVLDNDSLREIRSLQSRGQQMQSEYSFNPPPGSKIVAKLMNLIKQEYPFVDILKPENEAVIPILLALKPCYREDLVEIASLWLEARRYRLERESIPSYKGNVAASTTFTGQESNGRYYRSNLAAHAKKTDSFQENPLQQLLVEILVSREDVAAFLQEIEALDLGNCRQNIVDVTSVIKYASGWMRLLSIANDKNLDRRLVPLQKVLHVLKNDETFNPGKETNRKYFNAAQNLASMGSFDYVIFGHTHLAKQEAMKAGTYLNSGTWCNLMKLPPEIFADSKKESRENLKKFLEGLLAQKELLQNRGSREEIKDEQDLWVKAPLNYVCLNLDSQDNITNGSVESYKGKLPKNISSGGTDGT